MADETKEETKFESGLPKPVADALPHTPVPELSQPEYHVDYTGQWVPGRAPDGVPPKAPTEEEARVVEPDQEAVVSHESPKTE